MLMLQIISNLIFVFKWQHNTRPYIKGGVGNFGETSSNALEFENTQP